jgi:hypothetical protein
VRRSKNEKGALSCVEEMRRTGVSGCCNRPAIKDDRPGSSPLRMTNTITSSSCMITSPSGARKRVAKPPGVRFPNNLRGVESLASEERTGVPTDQLKSYHVGRK